MYFETVIVEVLIASALFFWLFYKYMTSKYTYWKDRSIAYVEPTFPFGTDKEFILIRRNIGLFYQSVYTKFPKEKVVGLFSLGTPYIMIRDPELLKHILTKDFNHFVDRGLFDPETIHPALRHLLHMRGESWKQMRHKLTPAFTSGKMKMMFHLMEACSKELTVALEPIAEKGENIVVKEFVACFTTDVIASCAFGLQANSIQNPDSEFRDNGRKLFERPPWSLLIKQRIAMKFPWIIKLHLMKPFTIVSMDFFRQIIKDTVAYREKNNVFKNDFVDILIKIKNTAFCFDEEHNGNTKEHISAASGEPGITLDEMTAQAILFFIAGFETASSTLNFCFYEMSVNTEVQSKMRKEINEVLAKHNSKISYDALQEMTYMEAVINETLRRYSSLSILNRDCTEDYKLPGVDFVIPKGMKILIPIYAIHHDPAYYPDPEKFDPERFTDDKIKTKGNYTFMPFGEGPRMCLGNRFAMMQVKICLSMVLQKYELAVTKETKIPLVLSNTHFVTSPDTPIVLKISKIKV